MELYIEYVVLDNVLIDKYILSMLRWTLGVKSGRIRIILFYCLSVIFAIIIPYVYVYVGRFLILYKLVTFAIMTAMIKKYKGVGEYLTYLIVTIMYTCLLAGLCYGLILGMNIKTMNNSIYLFNQEWPMAIIITIMYLLIFVIKRSLKYIYKNIKKQKYIYHVELIDGGRVVCATGYYDSGNCVENNSSGVSIVTMDLFRKLYKDIDIVDILIGKEFHDLKNMKYIKIGSIDGSTKYLTCMIDAMKVNDVIIYHPYLAVAYRNFGNYDVILHKDILEGIK